MCQPLTFRTIQADETGLIKAVFPYAIGLKPYSRRAEYEKLSPTDREALDWFRTYAPERTLYNWQNAAAQLVAQDLRERQQENAEIINAHR